jgi:pimeloyl-ACP methyl ester carboxylesterase
MVTLTQGVAVEVLEWGGRGRPLVFLAGLGNSPHVYDSFAPAFIDRFRVFGITRRGFGHSDGLPANDPGTLVNDLRTVLDSLRLARVILAGHSIAGEELTGFCSAYPQRCEAIVYLDAAYDRSSSDSKLSRELDSLWRPAVSRPPMMRSDSVSPTAVEAYYARNAVRGLPEAEVRAITRFDSSGRYAGRNGYDSLGAHRIGELMGRLLAPEYRRLKCPSLAIYAVADSAAAYFPWYRALDSANQHDALRYFRAVAPGIRADMDDFRQNAPLSHVVEIHDASHWVFLSNPDETMSAMRTFLLKAGS